MSFEEVYATKWYSKVWRWLGVVATYFSKQNRYERAHKRRVVTPETIALAKRNAAQHWNAKKENGRLLIQHGGTITTPPFPPRGSLLTEEERNDPLYK